MWRPEGGWSDGVEGWWREQRDEKGMRKDSTSFALLKNDVMQFGRVMHREVGRT